MAAYAARINADTQACYVSTASYRTVRNAVRGTMGDAGMLTGEQIEECAFGARPRGCGSRPCAACARAGSPRPSTRGCLVIARTLALTARDTKGTMAKPVLDGPVVVHKPAGVAEPEGSTG